MDREKVAAELERAALWARHRQALIDNLAVEPPFRRQIAAAFQHLGLEHHAAIVHLIRNEIHGSAFALFRSQFDAFTRGVWIRACATNEWVERFLKDDKEPPKIKTVLQEIEQTQGYEHGYLSDFHQWAYGQLCDYTHGGANQIRARVADGKIEQAWASEHLVGLIRASSDLCYLGCIELARLVDDAEITNKIAEAHQAIYDGVDKNG